MARFERLIAPITEPVAEPVRGERPTETVDQEGEITGRAGVDNPIQFRDDRNFKPNGLVVSALVLGKDETPLAYVLALLTRLGLHALGVA